MRSRTPFRRSLLGSILVASGALASIFAASTEAPVPTVSRAERRAQALAELRSGDAAAAAEAFASLLEEDATDLAAVEGRVRSLLRMQRWRAALEEARGHAAARPAAARVRTALAEALFRAGRLDEIESVVAEIAELEGAPGRALAVLGRLRAAEGKEEQAVELMARAVAAAPEDRDVLYWASGSTVTRGESVDRLERYLELSEGDDPDRIEAARSGIEVLKALGERQVWVAESRPERASIPLTRIWDPMSGTTQGFVVRIRLGESDKAVPLLLDSGSPGLFVIRRAAHKRGLRPLAEQAQFGGGGAGRHRTTRGLFSSVAIGELRFREALASSSKQEMDPTGRFHGVIGLAVFNGYRVTLDFEEDRLLLEPPGEQPDGAPYWTVEGQWLVPGRLGSENSLFLFDTGATHTLVSQAAVDRIPGAGLGPAVSVHGFGGRISGARRVRGVEVAFQGIESGAGPMSAIDLSTRNRLGGVELAGFIGLDLLDRKRIVIDTVHRRISVP